MKRKVRILIVEDDSDIAEGLLLLLRSEGYDPARCARGDAALETVRQFDPALIILDLMLPGLSGYDVCRHLREQNLRTPILMVTAKCQELDKVTGFELGADDYLTKPFGVRELLARIQALLRRVQPAQQTALPAEEAFLFGGATVLPATYELRHAQGISRITPKELALLKLFKAHPRQTLSRDYLLNRVWGYAYFGTTRTLDQAILQLRRKLGNTEAGATLIVTVHGVGYRYQEP